MRPPGTSEPLTPDELLRAVQDADAFAELDVDPDPDDPLVGVARGVLAVLVVLAAFLLILVAL